MISARAFENTRIATIDDVGGILDLIQPLRRQAFSLNVREDLEFHIESFVVMERDGAVLACAALHALSRKPVGELACLAVS